MHQATIKTLPAWAAILSPWGALLALMTKVWPTLLVLAVMLPYLEDFLRTISLVPAWTDIIRVLLPASSVIRLDVYNVLSILQYPPKYVIPVI